MSRKLVAYFSASGVTRKVAKVMAEAAGADIFEIEPEIAYTRDDLNWNNPESRSSKEMKDKSHRPKIAKAARVENMADYDVILLGFPIWWYVAPTIINTFLEQYDLSGKKIVLFATSGSSGMGKTMDELKPSAPQAEFVAEQRVEARITVEEAKSWLMKLAI